MTAQNAELIRRGYDAFARADLPAVFEMLDTEITWHVPGTSPLSGDYKGHGEVGGFFARTMELSGGRSPSTSRTSSPRASGSSCCARCRPNVTASPGPRPRCTSGG